MDSPTNIRRQLAADVGLGSGIAANNSPTPTRSRLLGVAIISIGVVIALIFTFKK